MVNKDQDQDQEFETRNNIFGLFVGFLVGGLAGAVAMLLMAPQSGKATRTQIQEKSVELRDRTTEMVADAMTQMSTDRKRMTADGQQKVKELFEQGQSLVIDQLDHVSEAALAGKKAIQGV